MSEVDARSERKPAAGLRGAWSGGRPRRPALFCEPGTRFLASVYPGRPGVTLSLNRGGNCLKVLDVPPLDRASVSPFQQREDELELCAQTVPGRRTTQEPRGPRASQRLVHTSFPRCRKGETDTPLAPTSTVRTGAQTGCDSGWRVTIIH